MNSQIENGTEHGGCKMSAHEGRESIPSQEQAVAVKAALAALRTYKVYVSPWFAGSCRYVPTCSVYAYEAIERFGAMRGIWMGLKRLLRCHPLSRKFGYDPVPEKAEALTLRDTHAEQEPAAARPFCKGAHS